MMQSRGRMLGWGFVWLSGWRMVIDEARNARPITADKTIMRSIRYRLCLASGGGRGRWRRWGLVSMVKEFGLLRGCMLIERQKIAEEDTSWVWVVWDRKSFGRRVEGTKRHLMGVNAGCHESLESSRYQQPTGQGRL